MYGLFAPSVLYGKDPLKERCTVQFTTPIKQNHLFRRLYAKGSSAVGSSVVVYAKPNGTGVNHLGISTGVKLGNAVVRNRCRRRLREAYRRNEACFAPGFDIVLVARSRTVSVVFAELEKELLRLSAGLSLLRKDLRE